MPRSKFAKRLAELGGRRVIYGDNDYELVRVKRDYIELAPWPCRENVDHGPVIVSLTSIADARLEGRELLLTSVRPPSPRRSRTAR